MRNIATIMDPLAKTTVSNTSNIEKNTVLSIFVTKTMHLHE